MKKISTYIIIAILGFINFSCDDDLLDTKPLDKYTELDVWSDFNLAQGFVYNTYASVIPELMVNPLDPDPKGGGAGVDDFTDNMVLVKSNKVALDLMDQFYDAGWATNNSYYFFGNAPLGKKAPIKRNSFEVIRDCNLIIEKVAASQGIQESAKPGLIAQGKMLRALIYFSKARLFGKYVIVDKVLTEEDNLKLPRSKTIKETYDFIIKDLQAAAEDLPLANNAEPGSLTKGAAYAYLAEIALHGAAYIETGKDDYYAIAKKASEDLIGLGYALDDDYGAVFNSYDTALNSSGIILGLYSNIDATLCVLTPMQRTMPNMEVAKTTGTPQLKESFLGWTTCMPSADLVDDYLVEDTDGVAKKWDQTSYYQDYINTGGFLSEAIYNEHRDARFFASIVQDSSKFFSNTVTTRVGGNMHYAQSTKGTEASTISGYFLRKGIYESIEGYKSTVFTDHHQVVMRLGRAYLNYAEVLLRLNDVSTAVEYINKTRTVHGKLPALSTGITSAEAWNMYKIERRVELFFENDRYWSLLRWGKEDGGGVIPELNDKQYTYFEISEDGKSFERKPVLLKVGNQKKRFSPKRYLFPVPQNERILNDLLDQNPGW
ncbi:RagB/SusD family nutrient uptake outer membrane protein [Cellulophaga sp. 20_2_10]|uniref:RagB/SusD family nutrient uptake outer membrane protein n=1 Tax=Cellulophaga sp. 20_2_10 TaxID=2942476 RepID=UPI00201B1DF0|nr:RagB/SusD family nutrient uptake outer membrane protein [Cellulophaga sp. 20_2_10]MCL5245327.1 RagB/SusD family nutrient uptake outer membrane protein [Cellulophaga sp. 20_2_10]